MGVTGVEPAINTPTDGAGVFRPFCLSCPGIPPAHDRRCSFHFFINFLNYAYEKTFLLFVGAIPWPGVVCRQGLTAVAVDGSVLCITNL